MRNTARIVPFTLALALLAGCAGTRVISPSSSASPSAPQSASSSEAQQALKTGLALAADTSLSKGAADENGCAQTDVLCAAVTVGEDGVIRACALDQVQVKVEFDNAGALEVLEGKLPPGISLPPAALEAEILETVRRRGRIAPELEKMEGFFA